MKKNPCTIVGGLFAATGIAVVMMAIAFPHSAHSHGPVALLIAETGQSAVSLDSQPSRSVFHAKAIAPFILSDTENDSPGTNIVTRIVTFTAKIGGAPPPVLQWEVDKGDGFVVIPGATNAVYRIGNAQVEHNGFYALFATNSAGIIHTTPQQLIVSEGVD